MPACEVEKRGGGDVGRSLAPGVFMVERDIHPRHRLRFSFWEAMNESASISESSTQGCSETQTQGCSRGCACGTKVTRNNSFTINYVMKNVSKRNVCFLSDVCLGLGFASILLSIFTWFFRAKGDAAHGERSGIFIGLWVPSFFMLAHRLARKAEQLPEQLPE